MVKATTEGDAATLEKAKRMVSVARTALVMDPKPQCVWFATIALRMGAQFTDSVPTMGVDGRSLYVNPAFCLTLSPKEVQGVLAHEVLHIALKHHCRRGARDPQLWNVAADLAINHILKEAGMTLPKCGLFPGVAPFEDYPPGLSAEAYYTMLMEKGAPQGMKGGADPGGCGVVMDAAGARTQSEMDEAARDVDVMVAQATQLAKQRGFLPGGMGRFVEELLKPKVAWADVLRRFVNQRCRDDFNWSRPNRRFVGQGIYLPGLDGERLGTVAALVDTSGSISGPVLQRFASELEGILSSFDVTLEIVYHDSAVAGTQTWKSSDGPLKLEPKGGGGTDHRPAFAHVDSNVREVACVVSLTDLYTCLPEAPPDYPVLFCVVGNSDPKAHFGEVIQVE